MKKIPSKGSQLADRSVGCQPVYQQAIFFAGRVTKFLTGSVTIKVQWPNQKNICEDKFLSQAYSLQLPFFQSII